MPLATSEQNLSAAYELLKQWTDIRDTDSIEELGPATVYRTSVVLWLMLFQRLNTKASLRDAVLHFVETAPDELKTNKRLREGSLSIKSSSYSDARHRLSLKVANWLDWNVFCNKHRNKSCLSDLDVAIRVKPTPNAPKPRTFRNAKSVINQANLKSRHQSECHWAKAHGLLKRKSPDKARGPEMPKA